MDILHTKVTFRNKRIFQSFLSATMGFKEQSLLLNLGCLASPSHTLEVIIYVCKHPNSNLNVGLANKNHQKGCWSSWDPEDTYHRSQHVLLCDKKVQNLVYCTAHMLEASLLGMVSWTFPSSNWIILSYFLELKKNYYLDNAGSFGWGSILGHSTWWGSLIWWKDFALGTG